MSLGAAPGHLQTTKNLLCNILSSFPMVLGTKGFKHCHFGILEPWKTYKSNKTICFSLFSVGVTYFVTCFMKFYWAETVIFIKKWQLHVIFLCIGWMDRGGQAFDHHSRNGGQGIGQQKLPVGPGIWPIFSNFQGLPRGMLAAGIDSHINGHGSCKCRVS